MSAFCSFTSTLCYCYCGVSPVCKWVMGSVRRWQTRWGCEVCYRDRESPADTLDPASYLKAASLRQDKVGQARPHSEPGLQCLITLLPPFIHSAHTPPIHFKCLVMLWFSLCGVEDTSQSTGCLLKAQLDMSSSGRTLRIRSMAGTPIIQLCTVCLVQSP